MANSFDKYTRRRFFMSSLGTTATLMLMGASRYAFYQKANVTTAQMRAAGRFAKLAIRPLRDNISVISGSGGNVLVIPGKTGTLIVDSGLATSRVQMDHALQSISPEPLRYLINTHWHFDHTDGNDWMHRAGATIVAHEKTRIRMQQRQTIPEFDGIYPPRHAGAMPTVTFDRVKTIAVDRREITLTRYTPAHTDADIRIYLADANVLHAGDTFFSRFYPFIDYNSGGNIDGMIAACRESLQATDSSTVIVGGHGPVGTRSDLASFERMLVETREAVARLKRAGASADEVVSRKPTAPFDTKWGQGFVSPDLFTWLIYRGV